MPHVLTPHLSVTDEQYDAAVAGLRVHRPDLTLPRTRFLDPTSWTVIPDGQGRASKAELFVHRSDSLDRGHVILNLWMAPDLRDAGKPTPHSHPAAFTSHILLGGYTERRYWRVNANVWSAEHDYRQGEANDFPIHQYHEIPEVTPGTLTLMDWQQILQAGDWGYLDPATGIFTRTGPDPVFRAHLAALNPQHQHRWA